MSKLSLANLSEWAAVGFSGIFAGSAFFINAVDVPAISTVKDTAAVRQYWKTLYNRAKVIQGPLALAATAAGVTSWYQSESEYRWVWLAGAGVMISVWPFYLVFMLPGIKELLKDDVIKEKGETWVRDGITRWNYQHMFRTAASMVANDVFLLAIFLTR